MCTSYDMRVVFVAPDGTQYADSIVGTGVGSQTPSKTRTLNQIGVWKIKFLCHYAWMDNMMNTGSADANDLEYTITVQ